MFRIRIRVRITIRIRVVIRFRDIIRFRVRVTADCEAHSMRTLSFRLFSITGLTKYKLTFVITRPGRSPAENKSGGYKVKF